MNYILKFKNQFGSIAKKPFAVLAVVALVFSASAPLTFADHDPYGGEIMDKIILCHDESGDGTDYHSSGGVSVNAAISGHGGHVTDIIPPFHFQTGNNDPESYPGLNWNDVNEDIWNLGACDGDGIIDEEPETGTLTLIKALAGDPSQAEVTDWTLEADGADHIMGVTGDAEITDAIVGVGSYTMAESPVSTPNFTASDWDCVLTGTETEVAVTNGNTVEVAADQDITCTITNTYDAPEVDPDTATLTLVKVVDGGQAVPADWTLNADGSVDDLSGTTGISGTVEVGNYDLSETGDMTHYVASDWVCMLETDSVPVAAQMVDGNTVTLSVDQDVTCTITNTFSEVPLYSISGKVYNDNNAQNGTLNVGDEAGLEAWTVYLDENDNNTLDGEEISTLSDANGDYEIDGLVSGCYTVREVLQSNWTQTEPTEVDDFEYVVGIGGAVGCGQQEELVSVLDNVLGLFTIKTAQAQVVPSLDATGLNFGNVEDEDNGGGGSSGGGSRSGGSRTPRVLGDVTSIPYQAPQVLGAELPRTGSPVEAYAFFTLVSALATLPLLGRKRA